MIRAGKSNLDHPAKLPYNPPVAKFQAYIEITPVITNRKAIEAYDQAVDLITEHLDRQPFNAEPLHEALKLLQFAAKYIHIKEHKDDG